VQDEDDVLDKEDLRSYDQLKTFLMSEDVKSPGASQCMVWIERSARSLSFHLLCTLELMIMTGKRREHQEDPGE
jgi:hypothetical protein